MKTTIEKEAAKIARTSAKKNGVIIKRPYSFDVSARLKQGKSWKLNVELDNDVAKALLAESKEIPGGFRFYVKLINNNLRKAYGIKLKKLN